MAVKEGYLYSFTAFLFITSMALEALVISFVLVWNKEEVKLEKAKF